MPRVRTGPVIGLIIQAGVLACLATTVGLDGTGWLAGLAYGAAVCAVLDAGLQRASRQALGPADWVTLSRAALAGGVIALVADSFGRDVPAGVLAVIASVALSLDWVDGQVARRTGTVSDLGARFDMEVDASLLLSLCVFAAHEFGPWVLVIGLMRYGFVAAMWVLPWMRGTLPPRYWRKVVAAAQGIVLVAAASGVLPRSLAVTALLAALAVLVESFGRDVLWLWHHRPAFVPAFGGGVRGMVRRSR